MAYTFSIRPTRQSSKNLVKFEFVTKNRWFLKDDKCLRSTIDNNIQAAWPGVTTTDYSFWQEPLSYGNFRLQDFCKEVGVNSP